MIVAQQSAPSNHILFDQYDALARLGRLQCRCQSGTTGTHHQHVAKSGALRITVGIGLGRGIAQARRLADEIFIEHPSLGRTEKGLVVKSGRKHWCSKP